MLSAECAAVCAAAAVAVAVESGSGSWFLVRTGFAEFEKQASLTKRAQKQMPQRTFHFVIVLVFSKRFLVLTGGVKVSTSFRLACYHTKLSPRGQGFFFVLQCFKHDCKQREQENETLETETESTADAVQLDLDTYLPTLLPFVSLSLREKARQ